VKIREKDADSPDLATALSNLGRLYRDQKRFADAEPLYKRALAIREKVYGADDPSVAAVLRNYAIVERGLNKQAEAKELDDRARKIEAANGN
jgi:tetratricopeptide (TPR) repeat protein